MALFDIDKWVTDLIHDFTKGAVELFTELLQELPSKASEYLTETPESFVGGSIFTMVREVSINAIVPIAIIILTMVVCYDFISQFMNKSTRDMDIEVVMKLCFKLAIGIFLLNNVFDLTTGVFSLGQTAVEKLAYTVTNNSPPGFDSNTLKEINEKIDSYTIIQCIGILFISVFCTVAQFLCNIITQVVCIARLLEIYIYCSISPIPFATLTNREWGGVGTNFIKSLFALAFQAFMMELCLAIFSSLMVGSMSSDGSVLSMMFDCMVMSIMLCFTMSKCGSISKSIFNAI